MQNTGNTRLFFSLFSQCSLSNCWAEHTKYCVIILENKSSYTVHIQLLWKPLTAWAHCTGGENRQLPSQNNPFHRMFWKGTVWENVSVLLNSSFYRIFQSVCSQAAFWSFLLTSRSSEGPIIEKSIGGVVSPAAHAKAAFSPWKMLSMFLKGGCRGLQKVKSHVMKRSFGLSRSLAAQQWQLKKLIEKNTNPHNLAWVFNTASITALISQQHQRAWIWSKQLTNSPISHRITENSTHWSYPWSELWKELICVTVTLVDCGVEKLSQAGTKSCCAI